MTSYETGWYVFGINGKRRSITIYNGGHVTENVSGGRGLSVCLE